jgi:HSP20 family molecular chaperone IbpA
MATEKNMLKHHTNQSQAAHPHQTAVPEKVQQRPAVPPPVDIYENEDKLLLVADMPGVSRDEMAIHFEKGQLTIEGTRRDTVDGNLLAAEFPSYDYRRTFLVPQGIDAEKISAELDNGILKVHLPKASSLKPRRIQISSGS